MGELADLLVRVWLPLIVPIGIGGLWPLLRSKASAQWVRVRLNALVIHVLLPALIFAVSASAHIDTALLTVPLISGGTSLCMGLLLYLVLYRSSLGYGIPNRTRVTYLLCGMFGNVLLIGYPVLAFFYGPAGERYAVFTDVLSFTPLVWTLGVWIAVHLGLHGNTGMAHSVGLALLKLPPLWAFVLGVGLNLSDIDAAQLIDATYLLGQGTIPVLLVVLGLAVPWGRLQPDRGVLAVVGVKLVGMPLIALGLVSLFADGLLHEPVRAGILETAMPVMTTAVLLADRFHLDTEAVALMIGWSTLLFGLLLPAWIWLL